MMMTPSAVDAPHPFVSLLRRYRDVFAAAWAMRHSLAGPRRLSDEAAFLPAALSLENTPAHPAPRRAAVAICLLFVIAVAWAVIGQVDIVAVASGRIVVSDRSKTLQPLETSVVKHVFVKDGDSVSAGQVLVELDATNAAADTASIREQLQAASSEAQRTSALMDALRLGTPPVLTAQAKAGDSLPLTADAASTAAQLQAEWADITAKLARLDAESAHRRAEISTVRELIAKLEATLPIARAREADFKSLTEQGFVSAHAGQDRTRERIEQERDLATQRARLEEAQAALNEATQSRGAYAAETQRLLRDRHVQATLKRQQLIQELGKNEQRSRLMQLTAAVAGTVQQVAVHAEVVVDNKDIGFVNAGDTAEIKLETFPFTRYGTIEATVKSVTADAVNDEKRGAIFPATLALRRSTIDVDGRRINLAPGMNVTAEIKTGRRRVIEYLLSPVQKTLRESLGER
jgi:hemolysin D